MKAKKKKELTKALLVSLVVFGLVLMAPAAIYGAFLGYYNNRVMPGVRMAGYDLSGLSEAEALRSLDMLEKDFLANKKLNLTIYSDAEASESGGLKVAVELDEIDLTFDPVAGVDMAWAQGRGENWWQNFLAQAELVSRGVNLEHIYRLDADKLAGLVKIMAEEIDKPGAEAEVTIVDSQSGKTIEITTGEDGWVLNQRDIFEGVLAMAGRLQTEKSGVYLVKEDHALNSQQEEVVKERAVKLIGKKMNVGLDIEGKESDRSWRLNDEELVGWLGPEGGYRTERVDEYVKSLAEGVNREAQNATFKFEGGRVAEFAPALKGIVVDESQSSSRITDGLKELEVGEEDFATVQLAVSLTEPSLQTTEVNDLGIKELLGRGSSTFRGSIPGRIHNVVLTASRLHGVLIPPDGVFSFNNTIGEVSLETGYQSAYVISNGRTELGDGGGVCQDSTTMFRAAMDAGLPILERRAHSYRVGYYEQNSQPGYDATVYSPTTDFKFKNDTPGHILIQAYADTKNLSLVIELYGTSDGRVAKTQNYQKWGYVPPPPPLYQDDPTLGPGVVKQIDWAAGGLKTKFDYVVTRGNETIYEKTFYSNFKPWQAVYLRGV